MYYPDGFQVAFVRAETLAERTCIYYFNKPEGFDFLPGQFVSMYLPGLDERDPDHERAFSIATSPDHEHLGFAVRLRDTTFKRGLQALKPGNRVEIGPAMGELVLPEPLDRPIVFIAGGIGITPFNSMLGYLQAQAHALPVHLVYANRHHAGAAWRDDLEALLLRWPVFQLTHVDEEGAPDRPSGSRARSFTGRIGPELLATLWATYPNGLFYLVGPDPMVEAVEAHLHTLGLPAEQLISERFYGY